MSSDEVGALIEHRFFTALAHDTGSKPSWFIRIERASVFLDLRGVDAIAFIRYESELDPVRIPIQIKSSAFGREAYYRKNPKAARARVPVIVIPHMRSEDEDLICRRLYRELGDVRAAGLMYEEFLKDIVSMPASPKGLLLMAMIETRRAKYEPAKAAPEVAIEEVVTPIQAWLQRQADRMRAVFN